uniref:DRBM domain-containing protein n=1 Tax=Guillardia theta TaxID=55529 RepID=A0A7S4KKV4_GUITH|mmetsp:Transcript_26565/g.87257  ORF Transcript_26565/g.87257 Transcript_26565/m.87257 type:complete len:710 (+) Transcript_26565:52-2181(+)
MSVATVLQSTRAVLSSKGKAASKRWLEASFPKCVIPISPRSPSFKFDHVLFDMNDMLHTCARNCKNSSAVCKRVFRQVDSYLRIFTPGKSVVLCFDGPGPIAKIPKQVESREKRTKVASSTLDSIDITPGTRFMSEVRELCFAHVVQSLEQRGGYRDISFYLSCSDVAGEGELKLVEWIHTFVESASKDRILFIGGDSDLTIQSLALRGHSQVYLLNRKDGVGLQRIKPMHFISLSELKKELETIFPDHSDIIRFDLLLLIIFNGNDYLPPLKHFNLQVSFEVYTLMKSQEKFRSRFLLDGREKTFDYEFLAEFLKQVDARLKTWKISNPIVELHQYVQEGSLEYSVEDLQFEFSQEIREEVTMWTCTLTIGDLKFEGKPFRTKMESKNSAATVALSTFYGIHDSEHSASIDKHQKDFVDLLTNHRKGTSIPKRYEPPEMIERYLKGVLWNIKMYIDGFVPDFEFMYSFKKGPSSSSVVNWIESKVKPSLKAESSNSRPLAPAELCLAVTPVRAADRLPLQYRNILLDETCQFHRHFKAKDALFQPHLFLPLLRKELTRIDPNLMTDEEKFIVAMNSAWTLLFHVRNRHMESYLQQGFWEGRKNTEWSNRPLPFQNLTEAKLMLLDHVKKAVQETAKKECIRFVQIPSRMHSPELRWPTMRPKSKIARETIADSASSRETLTRRQGSRDVPSRPPPSKLNLKQSEKALR